MVFVTVGLLVAAGLLAFANGANDNAKGVATLIGSGRVALRPAIVYAAVATAAGSVGAVWLGAELASKFKGKGIVDAAVLGTAAFPVCVGLAAAATVLIATRMAMPISTTHAMVGSIIGVGVASGSLSWPAVWSKFFYPLLAAPLLAIGTAGVFYLVMRGLRRACGVTAESCLCVGKEAVETGLSPVVAGLAKTSGEEISGAGALPGTLPGAGALTVSVGETGDCERRYVGGVLGIDAQRVVDGVHFFSAGAISFARGLNDTPKVAALLIGLAWMPAGVANLGVGLAIALGGLLAVRRVAGTMAHRITDMNDGQALSANLNTAALVIVASRFGLPVSTTHVSCGSLFGIGVVSGQAHGRTIAAVLLAWVTTLPVAAVLGGVAWWVLG